MTNFRTSPPPLAYVGGWPINIATQADAVSRVIAAAEASEAFSVFTLNLDHIVKLRRDAAFRQAYESARFITADGQPVATLASRQGQSIERTTGADLVVPLTIAASEAKLPIYLYGTRESVLDDVVERLRAATFGRVRICGQEAPAPGFDPHGEEAGAALERISQSGARLCFVALGAPKQELFAARAVKQAVPCGFVCVGAALDFIANAQVRAPKLMQDYGLEWAWRLGQNPGGLGPRYGRCAVVMAQLATQELLRTTGIRGEGGKRDHT